MRNYLKILTTVMVGLLVACALSAYSFAASTPFTDVGDKNDEALSESVALLVNLGITNGTSETTFGTVEGVTRQQMSAFLYRLLNPGRDLGIAGNSTKFVDLVDVNYFSYVSWASSMGIIKGTSETTFNPKGGIILQDAYTMIARALGHEDEDCVYPFTYIDIAEEIGLDNNLSSALGYDSVLTRGDVAIILYNAFFAETGKLERTKAIKHNIDGNFVIATEQYSPTVAEHYYDVEVGEYTVHATPHYSFNLASNDHTYKPLLGEFEADTMRLVAIDADEPLGEIYTKFEGTGLIGEADDYIMQKVKVYYTYKVEGNKTTIDRVYAMTNEHKELETNSVSTSFRKVETERDYYNPPTQKYAKVNGEIKVADQTMYFFDAPYSYAKPNYNSIPNITETQREYLRNAKNLKLIDIESIDIDDGTYNYFVGTDSQYLANNEFELYKNLKRMFAGTFYKMKFYDVDGDDIYEYVHYMPATYGFMDGDNGKDFVKAMSNNSDVPSGNAPIRKEKQGSELDLDFTPTIYYNNANITGKSFKDGDMVIAYLNPAANMIDIQYVVEPYTGYVSWVQPKDTLVKVDGISFVGSKGYRLVEGYFDGSTTEWGDYHNVGGVWEWRWNDYSKSTAMPGLTSYDSPGELFNLYSVKVPVLSSSYQYILYYDHVEDASVAFGKDKIIIPMTEKHNTQDITTRSKFDVNADDTIYYAKAYYNGEVQYMPLDVKEMLPALGKASDTGSWTGSQYNLAVTTDTKGEFAYYNKLCKFVQDKDTGLYTLIPLLHAEDDTGSYTGIDKDSSIFTKDGNNKLYGNDLGYGTKGVINKVAGTRFELVSAIDPTRSLLGDTVTIPYFDMKGNTRIVIKNWTDVSKNEYEVLEFTSATFKSSSSTPLENIQYVLKGNPESKTRANLVLLYAEAVNFEFDVKSVKDSWRIVKESNIVKDEKSEDGVYRNFYTVYNPYTGEIEENIPGEEKNEKAAMLVNPKKVGTILEIKNGYLDEDGKQLNAIGSPLDTSNSQGLVWISEYDEQEGFISVVPVEATDNEIAAGNICCETAFTDFVDGFSYNPANPYYNFNADPNNSANNEAFHTMIDAGGNAVAGPLYYEVTEDTVITVLTSKEAGSKAFEDGEIALSSIEAIKDGSKSLKSYNEKVLSKNGTFNKGYNKYVKAYVYTSEARKQDEVPTAQFILIVVNGEEKDTVFANAVAGFKPKNCGNH